MALPCKNDPTFLPPYQFVCSGMGFAMACNFSARPMQEQPSGQFRLACQIPVARARGCPKLARRLTLSLEPVSNSIRSPKKGSRLQGPPMTGCKMLKDSGPWV